MDSDLAPWQNNLLEEKLNDVNEDQFFVQRQLNS